MSPQWQGRAGVDYSTPRLRTSETPRGTHHGLVASHHERGPEGNGHGQVSCSSPSNGFIYEASVPGAGFPSPAFVRLAENDNGIQGNGLCSTELQDIPRFNSPRETLANQSRRPLVATLPSRCRNDRNIWLKPPSAAHQWDASSADGSPADVRCECPTG